MKTLVLGARGMLGRELVAEFPGAVALDLPDLDIRDEGAVRARLAAERPELVVNAAADTRVDLCESDASHLAVNDEAVGKLARACRDAGAMLAHVSTDYVFSGRGARPWREDDPVDPVNAYGRGKLGGERRFLESGARGFVVRTSCLFGLHGANFVDAILRQAEGGKTELKVVSDQEGRPTYAPDLARAIRLLAETGAAGLFQFQGVAGFQRLIEFLQGALLVLGRLLPFGRYLILDQDVVSPSRDRRLRLGRHRGDRVVVFLQPLHHPGEPRNLAARIGFQLGDQHVRRPPAERIEAGRLFQPHPLGADRAAVRAKNDGIRDHLRHFRPPTGRESVEVSGIALSCHA